MDEELFEENGEPEDDGSETESDDPTEKAQAKRDGRGRYVKGQSGNPGGRPKVPEAVRKYARLAPEKMVQIASDESTPVKVRADIWKWFAEMHFGKPRQQVDMDASVAAPPVAVRFEGMLDEWSR